MVGRLITALVEAFRALLAGETDLDTRVVAHPLEAPPTTGLPALAVYPTTVEWEAAAVDRATEPRPQPLRARLAVDTGAPGGPYALSPPALAGSVRVRLQVAADTVDERRIRLEEGTGFALDATGGQLTLLFDAPANSWLLVSYSAVGHYTTREFRQAIALDVLADGLADVERWTSLATGLVLVAEAALLEDFNELTPTSYTAGDLRTSHTLTRLELGEAEVTSAAHGFTCQTTATAHGQLTASQVPGETALLSRVRSPTGAAGHPQELDLELES